MRTKVAALAGRPAGDFTPSVQRRILCVSHDAGRYGAQLLALHIVRELSESLGFQVTTVLLGGGPLRSDFEKYGAVLDFGQPSWREKASAEILKRRGSILRRLAADGYRFAICNTTSSATLLPLLKESGFETVSLVHELPNLLKQFNLQDAAKAVATLANHVVFPADYVRERFDDVAPLAADRVHIRPQGLYRPNPYRQQRAAARNELLREFGLGGETKLVVAAGQGDRRKGLDIFSQVAAIVARQETSVHFVWMGDVKSDELARDCRAWLDATGLASQVHFTGVVEDPDLYARYMAGADLYLMTSREDPYPSVVLDAMTVGVPVVGFTGAGGFCELLQQGAGVLVPMEDRAAMASTVIDLLRDDVRAAALGHAGQAIIDQQFDFGDYVQHLLGLLGLARPRVSVVLPNFNYARYLPERIASIVGQTQAPFEIIFLDDNSSDDSVAVATDLLQRSGVPHRIIVNESNAGCYAQWLRGLALARGELVWIAEADDFCEPKFLEVLTTAFEDSDVVLAYCQSRQVDGTGQLLRPDYRSYTDEISPTKWLRPYLRSGMPEIADTLAIKNTVPNASAVVMRKPNLDPIRDRLLGLKNAGDWLTYVHVLESGSVSYSPEVLNSHRIHANSVTKGGHAARLFGEILQVQEYIRSRHELAPETQAKVEAMRQFVFEYLGLASPDSPSYLDHPLAQSVSMERGPQRGSVPVEAG